MACTIMTNVQSGVSTVRRRLSGAGRIPSQVRLRTYRVGFGDCLLLTVTYEPPGKNPVERHLLIDLGTKSADDDGPDLSTIAALVAEHCGGHLEVIVATHRHQDHITGFGIKKVSTVIDELRPGLVIRPWTDVPTSDMATRSSLKLGARSTAFLNILDGMHHAAQEVSRFAFDSVEAANRAEELAELGFKNPAAIAALEQWAARARGRYVKAGDRVAVSSLMPGVTIDVLGPPTLEQVPRLTSYAKTSEEYWLGLVGADRLDALTSPTTPAERDAVRTLAPPAGLGAAEWLLRTLRKEQLGQGLELFEAFDDVLNNTSVILLVTVGDRTLLLPGDAQAENWSFTLDVALGRNQRRADDRRRDQLANVDVYKVGHHGSRNATPTSLYRLWRHRRLSNNPLTTVLTTKKGVFAKSKEGEVPHPRLIEELKKRGRLYSTDNLDPNVWWFDLTAPAQGKGRFSFKAGPPRTTL